MFLRRARNWLGGKRGGFGLDVLKLAGGTTGAQAITVLSLPLLARLFPPDAFGAAGLFTSLVAIGAVVSCLRYEFAIMLPESDEQAANVFGIALSLPLVFAGASAIGLAVAGARLVAFLNAPALLDYLWLLPIALALAGMFQALNYWNTRRKRFGRVSVVLVAASATSSALQLGAGIAGQTTAGGLIVGATAGTTMATSALGILIWRDQNSLFRRVIRPRRMWENAKRFRKFPLVDAWGALLNNLAWQLPALLLSIFFTQSVVGYYAMANRVIQLPMALIGASISQVFYQRASAVRADSAALVAVIVSTFDRLVTMMLIPALLLTLVGRELFLVVLGPAWEEAGFYVQILGLWTLIWFIASPFTVLFLTLEYQGRALLVNIIILVSRVASLILGGLNQNVVLALLLFTISGLVVYGGMLIWVMRLAGVPSRAVLDILARRGPMALLFAAAIALVKFFGDAYPVFVLLASLGLGALYYLWIFRQSFMQTMFSARYERQK
ncbi:MAG: hypothetical protein HDKAJFGB_00258 [Anaerolineae bacterium]|nr:hypothetical protein [Anaerolineae bacterium]